MCGRGEVARRDRGFEGGREYIEAAADPCWRCGCIFVVVYLRWVEVYHRRGCGWPAGGVDEGYSSCRANKQMSSKQSQQSKPKYRVLSASVPNRR